MSDARLTKAEEIEFAWAQPLVWRPSTIRSRALRERLAEAPNWRCCCCGVRMGGVPAHDADAPTFEHVIPRSRGGIDDIENLVIACRRCNGKHGDAEDGLA
ncbi:MAG TPA: HNH endonuclease signature motif containing protein [Acetobacteraceae bacterium]